jgi:hypothetical protein
VDHFRSFLIALLTAAITSWIGHRISLDRLRKEAAQKHRSSLFQRQVTAYMKFWALLGPTSIRLPEGTIISQDASGTLLNIAIYKKFRQDLITFFHSEYGIFLSRDVRHAMFKGFDFIEELIARKSQAEPEPASIAISNTDAKKVEEAFRWLRERARRDLDLQDLKFELREMKLLE